MRLTGGQIMSDTKRRTNVLLAAVILAAVAFLVPGASPAHAAGLINCVPLSLTDRSGACWKSVWVNAAQRRMVIPHEPKPLPGDIPRDRAATSHGIPHHTDTPQGRR